MIINHYGVEVNTEVPVPGVIQSNIPGWLYEDASQGIDLLWEEHIAECNKEYHDLCGPQENGTILIGYMIEKKSQEGVYFWGKDPEAEYSAIVNCDGYTIVTQSKWVSRCAGCSPCYPGSGDLTTKGDFLTYALPPDLYGEAEHLFIEKLE